VLKVCVKVCPVWQSSDWTAEIMFYGVRGAAAADHLTLTSYNRSINSKICRM
jgi:hypothetical protein